MTMGAPAVFRYRNAFGGYSYLEARLTRRLYAGFLFEYVQDLDTPGRSTKAYSPYLTLWASEFPSGTSLDVAGWVKAVKKGLLKKTDARTREAWQLVKQFSAYWQRGAISGAG